jgi:hypothetical protein
MGFSGFVDFSNIMKKSGTVYDIYSRNIRKLWTGSCSALGQGAGATIRYRKEF